MPSKNITLSMDEDMLQRLRVLAAMRRTSVNGLIRDLAAAELGEASHEGHRAEWEAFFKSVDSQATEAQRTLPAGLPTKAELHDEDMRERGLL